MQRSIRRIATAAVAVAAFAAGWSGYLAIAQAADTVTITLNGTSATSSSTTGVTISGSTVTITAAGSYQLTGSLTNGQVVVNSTDSGTVALILSGVSIANSTTSPLNINDAGAVTVTLAAGTSNTLSDASSYVYPDAATTEPDAALFSKADLTITGTGALNVRGNAYDGIASKDGLLIESGNITVNAADDGIRGKDYLRIAGGTLNVTSTGDGLKSTNDSDTTLGYLAITSGTVSVTAGTDCVQAVTSITISGGSQTLS